jgi:hypothetical protein
MTLLLPRLDRESARNIVADRLPRPLAEVSASLPDLSYTVTFSPVGGTRVSEEELGALRHEVVQLAREHGFPGQPRGLMEFEGDCARLLHTRLPMTPHESSHEEAWSYLTCCWLLDIALWRFGSEADERRFIGNVNRNTFRRLWWRAEILGPDIDLRRLGEDELVNIMERPTIAGDRRLARAVAGEFLRRLESGESADRMLLMREAMKRLLRLTPFVAFWSLSGEEVADLVSETFDAAGAGLEGQAHRLSIAVPSAAPEPSSSVTQLPRIPTVAAVTAEAASGLRPDLEEIAEVALEIAQRTGRVTNMSLREVVEINSEEAREVFAMLMSRGALVRRGIKRGTHYVLPDAPVEPAPVVESGRQVNRALGRLLGRGR